MSDTSFRRLPRWPSPGGERSDGSGPLADGWLVAAGLAYPVVGFAVQLLGGGRMGPAAFGPEVVVLPAVVAVSLAVGLRWDGARLTWPAVGLFVGWVVAVAVAQWYVWAAAVASV